MITKDDNIAIIGSSHNPDKYGYKVSADLINKGYKIFLVNPKGGKILGRTVHKKVYDIDADINAVIFVVPPKVTEEVLKDVCDKKIRKVWMQPGSESDKAIAFCRKNGIECVHNACIMMQ